MSRKCKNGSNFLLNLKTEVEFEHFMAEKYLLVAVIERAILDYYRGVRCPHLLEFIPQNAGNIEPYAIRDARAWLRSRSCSPWSFKWMCEVLEFDWQGIRNAIFTRESELAWSYDARVRKSMK